MVRSKPFRNGGLPRDLQSAQAVVEIQPLEFPLIAEPARGIITAFRVDFRGDEELWQPGAIEVAATLVRRTWDEERQTWCRERIEYQVRASDLTPGQGGRACQLKPTEIYRLEFTPRPTNCTETDLPSYDFSKFGQIEIRVSARAHDSTVAEKRITCELAPEAA